MASSFRTRRVSDKLTKIRLNRNECGSLWATDEGWRGRLTFRRHEITTLKHSAQAAFDDLCKRANRIALCGADDAAAANSEIDRLNELCSQQVAAVNAAAGAKVARVRRTRVLV